MAFKWNFDVFSTIFPIFNWSLIFFPMILGILVLFYLFTILVPFFSFFLQFFYHFCAFFPHFLMIFLPFPTENLEQKPQIPKISDLIHRETEPGGILGQNPQILGLFAAQTLKIWVFFPKNLRIF